MASANELQRVLDNIYGKEVHPNALAPILLESRLQLRLASAARDEFPVMKALRCELGLDPASCVEWVAHEDVIEGGVRQVTVDTADAAGRAAAWRIALFRDGPV